MKKIKCFIIGHKIVSAQCPFTKARLESCSRCGKGSHSKHGKMSFS